MSEQNDPCKYCIAGMCLPELCEEYAAYLKAKREAEKE